MELKNVSCLLTVLETLNRRSFTTQFEVRGSSLFSLKTKQEFDSSEVQLVQSYGFESKVNFKDRSFLYVIETHNNEKGTISNGYGTSSDIDTASFLLKLKKSSK